MEERHLFEDNIEGKGFFDVKLDYTNVVKATLEKYGNDQIIRLRILRKPLSAKIQYALKFVNSRATETYDTLFHLGLIATIKHDNYQKDFLIEKNEVIEIEDNFNLSNETTLMDVPLNGQQITLKLLMENTRKGMGDEKYFKYSAWTNNCQYFVDAILKYNNLLTPSMHNFLFQNLQQIIDTTPWLARKTADFVTHTAGLFRKLIGRGHEPIFYDDVEKSAIRNDYFRNVQYTTPDKHMQVVYMSLKPREEIGLEKHDNVDQFFRIESGKGKLNFGKTKEIENKRFLKPSDAFLIPAKTWHNVKNSSYDEDLKLYTIYSPANHPVNRRQVNKPNE